MSELTDDLAAAPVIILCGGTGVFIDDSGRRCNKALVRVSGQTMLSLVMKIYVKAGFRNFILAAGIQSDRIRAVIEADHNGAAQTADRDLYAASVGEAQCRIRVVETPAGALTGDRIKQCARFVADHEWLCVTYSDTLAPLDVGDLVRFHRRHGRLATLVAVPYPVRFRILGIRLGESQLRGFADQPVLRAEPINGGFYVFQRQIFDSRYLGHKDVKVVLEDDVLDRLAADQQLMTFRFDGGWQNLDSERDLKALSVIARALSV